MEVKAYKDYTETEEYNPEKKKHFKTIDDGTGMTFTLYEDELVESTQPGESQAIIITPTKKGDHLAKTARFKKGWRWQPEQKEKMKASVKRTIERKKQIKELSVMVKELLADPELPKLMVKNLPPWAEQLDEPNAAALIIGSAIMKAMDTKNPGQIQAAEFLHKVGWGQKMEMEVTGENSFFKEPTINFTVVESREQFQELKKQELTDDSVVEGEVIDKEEQ